MARSKTVPTSKNSSSLPLESSSKPVNRYYVKKRGPPQLTLCKAEIATPEAECPVLPTPIATSPGKHPTRFKGGKNRDGLFQNLINLFPPCRAFIEGFAGSGPMTRIMKQAELNIVVELDPKVTSRYAFRKDVIVLTGDIENFISTLLPGIVAKRKINPQDVLIYLDPPYPLSTKITARHIYKYSYENFDHERLCHLIVKLPYKIAISSYRNPLYDDLLRGWNRFDFKSYTRKGKSIESVYMNYMISDGELHDYSFAGHNFTRRQQVKRIGTRMVNRLQGMHRDDRNTILSFIRRLHSVKPAERNAILYRISQHSFSRKKSDIL